MTKQGEVVALPGADRVEDSLKFLQEALAAGARGVIFATVSPEGNVEVRCYGGISNAELAWAGGVLTSEAFG